MHEACGCGEDYNHGGGWDSTDAEQGTEQESRSMTCGRSFDRGKKKGFLTERGERERVFLGRSGAS